MWQGVSEVLACPSPKSHLTDVELVEIFLRQASNPPPLIVIELIESAAMGMIGETMLTTTWAFALHPSAVVVVNVYVVGTLTAQSGEHDAESESPVEGDQEQTFPPDPNKMTGTPAQTEVSLLTKAIGLV